MRFASRSKGGFPDRLHLESFGRASVSGWMVCISRMVQTGVSYPDLRVMNRRCRFRDR